MFENIEEIKADHNYSYFLKLRCNNCGESDDIWHDICAEVFINLVIYHVNIKQLTKYSTGKNSTR
jgi:hypothetical protein